MARLGTNNKQAERFAFTACRYDPASGEALLAYEVDGLALLETLVFPWAPWPADASRQAAFERALELLHLIAGISYYKAVLASTIVADSSSLNIDLSNFLNELYLRGLGEFAHVNQLDLSTLTLFEANTHDAPLSHDLALPERALVAMGGGKDSLVCLELLRKAGIEVQPVCVGGSELIGETVKAAGLPLIRIERQLAPQLADLNQAGAWNGHVPVTAINSAILVCAAILYGYRYVVFANESSANEATLTNPQGLDINHQYSKSLAFEQSFGSVIRQRISSGVAYFSVLRPFGEIAIARRFAALQRYHPIFSSCNRNFHQDGSHIDGRWCRDCPKCRFTALALAPFITPAELLAIQGVNLLDETEQLKGFRELCGLGEEKPFECVGSIAESRAAVKYLSEQPQWCDKAVIRALGADAEIKQSGRLVLQADPVAEHCIPTAILQKLDAF